MFFFDSITSCIHVAFISACIVFMALTQRKKCITICVTSIQIKWQRSSFELQGFQR